MNSNNVECPVVLIQSGTGLWLTVTDAGGITVEGLRSDVIDEPTGLFSTGPSAQMWTIYPVGGDIMLLNWRYNNTLNAMAINPDGSLTMIQQDPDWLTNVNAHWNQTSAPIRNTIPTWAFPISQVFQAVNERWPTPSGGVAIRAASDWNRNLNILGDGPYNPGAAVAAWEGWSGGASNEIWRMIQIHTQAL